MRERTARLLGSVTGVWLATFHSLCARILRRHAARIGRRHDFAIYDDADQRTVIRQVAAALQLAEERYPPNRLLAAIDRAKNDGQLPGDLAAASDDPLAAVLS